MSGTPERESLFAVGDRVVDKNGRLGVVIETKARRRQGRYANRPVRFDYRVSFDPPDIPPNGWYYDNEIMDGRLG